MILKLTTDELGQALAAIASAATQDLREAVLAPLGSNLTVVSRASAGTAAIVTTD